MGENLGTIDASAYLIVPGGITRCPNASASSGSTPKTGRPFNNIRVFPEQTAYELLPLLYFSAIQRFNGHKRQASHALAWSAKLIRSMSKAWSASLLPDRASNHRKRRGACRQICAS